MKTLWKQRGFFLNPYRFPGSTLGAALHSGISSTAVFGGAAIASAEAAAGDGATLTFANDQLGAGAFSAASESGAAFDGAAAAASAASMVGEGGAAVLMAQPQITVDAADFDATNDYMLRGGALTGAADSKRGILSFWLRLDGGDGGALFVFTSNSLVSSVFLALRRTDNKIGIGGDNAAGTEILLLVTGNTYTAGATWRHVLASWDLSAGVGHLYINDVSDLGSSTLTDDTIDYTQTEWAVGGNTAGGGKFNGCMAEFYFAPGEYLDFSVEANRRRFISSSGKPVDLGPTGSAPTGSAPIIYLHLDDAEAATNFASNAGTGGNFTITGTLDTASSSPSD